MTAPAKSVFVFSLYMFASGATFLVAPNAALPLVCLPTTSEVWIRVVGLLMLLIGFYYCCAARAELRRFFPWTVVTRCAVLAGTIGFVLMKFAGPTLLIFGAIDFLGAMWTLAALRRAPAVSSG